MFLRSLDRLGERLAAGGFHWLFHRCRMALGVRSVLPRPEPSVSRLGTASSGRPAARDGAIDLLVFSHNLDHEGASISLKELVCGLSRRRTAAPVVMAFKEGPLRAEYEELGIRVQVLPELLHRMATRRRLRREVEALARRIRALGPQAVLANTLLNFPAVLAAELAAVPSVWIPRESEPWHSHFRFLPDPVALQATAAIGLPRKVVFVAEATRALWRDFDDAARFSVIHNALDQERFTEPLVGDKAAERRALGWGENEVVFLCVGTLCERKGQADAIRAIEAVASDLRAPVRLVLAGDASGSYGRQLQRRAARVPRHAGVRVSFVDSTAAVGRYYRAADVFLLCSRSESYPRVVLEALAFGLPIVSTRVFGVAEQLPDVEDACFYEPGDIESLARHLRDMANDSLKRQRFKERAQARFRRLPTFDQMLSAYEAVLEECVYGFRARKEGASETVPCGSLSP